jgi:hypothetical protein
MESRTVHPTDITSLSFTATRWFLTFTGIVTAVVCSLVLLTEVPGQGDQKHPVLVKVPTPVIVRQIAAMPELSISSILARF